MTANSEVIRMAEPDSYQVNGLLITNPDAVEFLEALKPTDRINAISIAVHFGLLALRNSGTISRMDWIDKRNQSFGFMHHQGARE